MFVIVKNLQNGAQYSNVREYLVKYDLAASKVTFWRMDSLYQFPQFSAETGHFDAVITGITSDARNLPVKGFIATSLYQIKYYNDLCDSVATGKINRYRSAFDIYDKSGNNPVRLGFFDRIEIDEKSCRKESTTVFKEVDLRQ